MVVLKDTNALTLLTTYRANFNNDSLVDGEDRAAWGQAYGGEVGADADADGFSRGSDFWHWQRRLRLQQGLPEIPAVIPEPRSYIHLLVGTAILGTGQRRMKNTLSATAVLIAGMVSRRSS